MNLKSAYGLQIRTVDESDAGFIVALRTDPHLSRYMSGTSVSLDDQVAWIKQYRLREESGSEYYFIALDDEGNRLGLTRLYNFDASSFEVGSWIYRRGLPTAIPLLGDLATRDFGFNELNFAYCRFEVLKGNEAVIRYHRPFKPTLIKEDERAYYFTLSREDYMVYRDKLLKIFFYG